MNLDERLEAVSVVGAAGKMGRGICLLLTLEMARRRSLGGDRPGDFRLHAIDADAAALDGLVLHIEAQIRKAMGRQPTPVREPDSRGRSAASRGEDDLERFVNHAKEILQPTVRLDDAEHSRLVFEAVVEDEDVKVGLLSRLRDVASPEAFFFSNTSSIPIRVLDGKAGLGGRIVGFHFFNPPRVQKLVELISHPGTSPELLRLAEALGRRLGKELIESRDVAGFVSNGFFVREGLHAIELAEELAGSMGQVGSVYALDRLTRDWLLRPMGIFQLIDYVGIDIFRAITQTMTRYIEGEDFRHPLIEDLHSRGVLGGQQPDGSQRAGFLEYAAGRPTGIFSVADARYVPFEEDGWTRKVTDKLGPPPERAGAWKDLRGDDGREGKIATYFENLRRMNTLGAVLSRRYLRRLRKIGEQLVAEGVASTPEDVNMVLKSGFHHLYGPISDIAAPRHG